MFFLISLIGPVTILAAAVIAFAVAGLVTRRLLVAFVSSLLAAAVTYFAWTWDFYAMNREVSRLCQETDMQIHERRGGVKEVLVSEGLLSLDPRARSTLLSLYRRVVSGSADEPNLMEWHRGSDSGFSAYPVSRDEAPQYSLLDKWKPGTHEPGTFHVERGELSIVDRNTNRVLGTVNLYRGIEGKSSDGDRLLRIFLVPERVRCELTERRDFIAKVLASD